MTESVNVQCVCQLSVCLTSVCVHAAGGMTTTFSSNDEVLAYIGNQILKPTWVDPVCGDGNCEYPWEFPAWGRFGCK